MSSRTKILVLVILPVLVAGSLYLRSLVRRVFFERRETPESSARARLNQAALQASAGPTQTVTLYFPSYSEAKLRGEARALALAPEPADRIRQIVLALVEGPKQGQASALSPSADIRAVFLAQDGTAYLDLSNSSLAAFNPGIESETLAVYSIVDSLAANLPEVKRVQFLVQGQEVDTLAGHADLTSPFSPNPSRIASASIAGQSPAPGADSSSP
ncbi:MAG TPA: GerMN domain-containing protein [Terriglobia bacterium]